MCFNTQADRITSKIYLSKVTEVQVLPKYQNLTMVTIIVTIIFYIHIKRFCVTELKQLSKTFHKATGNFSKQVPQSVVNAC